MSEELDTTEAYEVAPGSERDRSRCSKGWLTECENSYITNANTKDGTDTYFNMSDVKEDIVEQQVQQDGEGHGQTGSQDNGGVDRGNAILEARVLQEGEGPHHDPGQEECQREEQGRAQRREKRDQQAPHDFSQVSMPTVQYMGVTS